MKSVSTPRNSSRSTPQALRTSAAEGLSSIASSRCSTVMNSCCFCRASTKAMWRETSSSCAIIFVRPSRERFSPLLQRLCLLHGALEWVLMLARDVNDLIDLGRRHLARVGAANPHPFAVHLQHHLSRFLATHREHSLQHHDHKVHRGVVVVQQDNLVQRRRLQTGLFDLENAPVLMLNRHAVPETPRPDASMFDDCNTFFKGNA